MITIRETTEVDHGLYGASTQVISSAILTLKRGCLTNAVRQPKK